MPRLNYSDTIDQNMKDKTSTEQMLGYGLILPFSGSVSGARQILFGKCLPAYPAMGVFSRVNCSGKGSRAIHQSGT